jgi:toxin ParE1/3/4
LKPPWRRFRPEMKLELLSIAQIELVDAAKYYESVSKGLGWDFIIEVKHGLKSIASHPETWAILHGDIRRILIRRFPYALLYKIKRDRIVVYAVMHLSRNPDSWKDRLK